MSERITIQTIESKEFTMMPRGYDREQVDAFLDEICDELERMNNEMNDLRQQLREAQAAASRAQAQTAPRRETIAPTPQPAAGNSEILGILELANRLKEQTIEEAKKQAEKIVADANTEVREHLGNLMEERDSLNNQVEALRKTAADYRERFTGLLQAQKDALEKISDL